MWSWRLSAKCDLLLVNTMIIISCWSHLLKSKESKGWYICLGTTTKTWSRRLSSQPPPSLRFSTQTISHLLLDVLDHHHYHRQHHHHQNGHPGDWGDGGWVQLPGEEPSWPGHQVRRQGASLGLWKKQQNMSFWNLSVYIIQLSFEYSINVRII